MYNFIVRPTKGRLAADKDLRSEPAYPLTDADQFPIRLHPFVASLSADTATNSMPIAIDPRISFGRPVILSRSISTATIAARIDAGETVDALAADYDLRSIDIEQAVLYERVA